jgi:hypothetical protein
MNRFREINQKLKALEKSRVIEDIEITGEVSPENLAEATKILKYYDFNICYIENSGQRAEASEVNRQKESRLRELGILNFKRL